MDKCDFEETWVKLLRQTMPKEEETQRKHRESQVERSLAKLAVSAGHQLTAQFHNSLEPKLDVLLAKKVKANAIKSGYHTFVQKGAIIQIYISSNKS